MNTLLSSISGQFGKMILLGTLFPVLIVSILNVLLVAPILPFGPAIQNQLRRIAIGEDKWSAVALLFVVLVITGVLYNLNIPIIRVYEGYPWQHSYLGEAFSKRKKERFNEAIPLRQAVRCLRQDLIRIDPNDTVAQSLQADQTALALFINSELPDREEFVLPTRLGNVIRCFERYSYVAYGIDAIVLWPRFMGKIDSAFAATIDEAKTSLDFMINLSFLCALSGLTVATCGLFSRTYFSIPSVFFWVWRAFLFLSLSALFYAFAIGRAKAWGEQVKAAFDLYRFNVLNALGYLQQPQTPFEEKALWLRITAQLLYADSRLAPVPYKGTATHLAATPIGVQLIVDRHLRPAAAGGNLEVELVLKNKDQRSAQGIVLSETVPDGFKVLLGSPRTSAGTMFVSNMAPLEMNLDKVLPQTTTKVTYTLKPSLA
jgi:hypothetical protein